MITRTLVVFLFLVFVIALVPPIALAQKNPFPNESAWSWYVGPEPAKKRIFLASDSVVLVLRDVGPKGIHAVLICLDDLQDIFELRAVAFDNSKKRYQLNGWGGASSNGVTMRSFLLPPDQLSWENLKFVGIEKMTKENQRSVIVPQAISKLKEAGVEYLTYPEIGKPYPFELTTMEGSKVSSQTLRGKVVLLDFWASWCTPCMQLLPDLKKTYGELKSRGFEVIGVNLDESIEKARGVTLKENLPWPIVVAPTNKQDRELWETAAGIQSIPRLWLIDRKEIGRAHV
jgi:thiol-disulfide isomerase/thioredoxin